MYELKRTDGSLIATGEDVYEAIYNSKGDLSHADLRREDLSHAKLSHAKLRHADLTDARLISTDLQDADLSHARLRFTDLRHAILTYAKLSHAELRHARLTDARLISTDLQDADLSHARLRFTDLKHAILTDAKLISTDLSHARLRFTGLRHAILDGVKWPKELQFTPDPELKKKIRVQVLNHPQCLNMVSWHYECGTVHCLAGWAVTLHPEGKRMEEASSTYLAGRLLLGLDHEEAQIFYSKKEQALEWLMED